MQNFKVATPPYPFFLLEYGLPFLVLKLTLEAMIFHVPCHLTATGYYQASLCLCEVCFAP